MSPVRLTASLEGVGSTPADLDPEVEMHPVTAMYVARLSMEEDLARAAAYRAARELRQARKAARFDALPAPRRRLRIPALGRAGVVRFGH
jgi:hypothetical protein